VNNFRKLLSVRAFKRQVCWWMLESVFLDRVRVISNAIKYESLGLVVHLNEDAS
jgi:hypothetical protein